MRKINLLLSGLLLVAAPALAQYPDGPMRTSMDPKVIFVQDFETDWETWSNQVVDQITQIEYYDHEGETNGLFKPDELNRWEKGLYRDTLINLYNRVEVTNAAAEIENNSYSSDNWSIISDDSYEHREALALFGEDGGTGYFKYEAGPYYSDGNYYGTHDSEGYAPNYRRYLSIPGIYIQPEHSYRLTFYVKATQTSDNSPLPRMYANIMRGIYNIDKPFSMGSDNYSNYFECKKDYFTGDWEKVTFMTYYLNDSVAQNYAYSDGYWWAEGYWTWNAYQNPVDYDLNYIVQPDKFFARLSFSSDMTEFQIDNLSVTESWIAGIDYYKDKLRVDFGYQTNISELAMAAYYENKINIKEVDAYVAADKINELGYEYYFEVWGLNKKGIWEDVPIRSAEYHDDGYLYMFTDFYMSQDGYHPFLFDDYDSILVTFHNPVDQPDLCIQYTGSRYPKALDTEWIQAGKIVPDFYNEIATPNPYVFSDVISLKDMPPVMQVAQYEEGSFGLPADTRELRFKFSREVVLKGNDPTKNAVAYVGNENWDLAWDSSKAELVLSRPAQYTADLEGDYEVQILQLYGIGTIQGDDVYLHYHFGPFERIPSGIAKTTDWKSEVTGTSRPYPTSIYIHSGTDPFKKGDGADSPGKCGLYNMNDEGMYDCGIYLSSRKNTTTGNLYSIETLTAGNYSIEFRACGWGSNARRLVLMVYPAPDQELVDGNDNGFAVLESVDNKTVIGEITSWDANITAGGNWPAASYDLAFDFNVPDDGDYVLEFMTDGSSDYKGVFFSNYSLMSKGDLSASYTIALNKSVDAAKVRLAAADENIDYYGGKIYIALKEKIAYYDYDPQGAFNSQYPSDWIVAKDDLDNAAAALKARMADVDNYLYALNNMAYIISDTEYRYSRTDAWQILNAVYNDALKVYCPDMTSEELAIHIYQFENAIASLNAVEIQTMRINSLHDLATRLGSDIVQNADIEEIYITNEVDNDNLAKVYMSAIKIALYQKLAENPEAYYDFDLTPFIKNYYLYQTPKIVDRSDKNMPDNSSAGPDPDGANIQYTQHKWNSGDLNGKMPIWVMITDVDYDDLYPGWTVRSFTTGGNSMVTGDKSYTNYKNGMPVFDAEIAMEWNSKAEMYTSLSDLPVGWYTLGVNLTQFICNESEGKIAQLDVAKFDSIYSAKATVNGSQLLAVEDIPFSDGESFDIRFMLCSQNGLSSADNFYLTFKPMSYYDYEAAIEFAQVELQNAINNLDSINTQNPNDPGNVTEETGDWISKNHNDGSRSSNTWKILATAESTLLQFDWSVSSEENCDWLSIILDGIEIIRASGEQIGTYQTYVDEGLHILTATYSKDGWANGGYDQATVTNIHFGTMADIITQTITHAQEVAANNQNINNILLAEFNDYVSQLEAVQYQVSDAAAVINRLNEYATRLAYTHLDINVSVPGSLGNIILAKVDNFKDVQSLRLTGKINDDDMITLKDKLLSIIDLDLSGLDWANIPDEQFLGRTDLQYVILPDNVESIGNNAFNNCINLKPLVFPATLNSIGDYTFAFTYNIGDVILPEGLSSMGSGAFYRSEITSVSFPSTLQAIREYCFSECYRLRTVKFNGQTEISYDAFSYCYSLGSIEFPETMQYIGYEAFANSGLNDIKLNEGLTSLGDYAFYNCDSLTAVTLPGSLQNYDGYCVFRSCDRLSQLTCMSFNPPYTSYGNITGRRGIDLYVPILSVNAYKQASGWDEFNIHGINIIPDNILVEGLFDLSWPDSLKDLKPNVTITGNTYGNYGSLTVNGNSTLSSGQFVIKYDSYTAYSSSYWDDEWGTWTYYRYSYASLVNNAHMRADNITLEYWIPSYCWDFITVPFDVKVSDIRPAFEGTPFVIRKYDGLKRAAGQMNETWVDMTADSTLHAGVGYIIRSASTDPNNRYYNVFYLDALQTVNKNNIFISDDVEVPLAYYESEFAHNRSWNLIGNPYPCFYDIRAMQTSAPIIIWDAYQNNYRALSPQDDSYILNPGQAFFVQRPVNEESIVFLKEGRQTNLDIRYMDYNNGKYAPGRVSTTTNVERSVFNIILSNGEQSDRTRFVINQSAQKAYEQGLDASKFASLVSVSQLYTIENDVHFAINERPLSDGIITLGMTIATGGIYTLTLSTTVDQEIWLMDKFTGKEILLNGDTGYTFNTEAGTYENRFTLRLGNGTVTGVKEIATEQQKIENIYDMQGRSVDAVQKGIYIMDGKKVVFE